MSKKLILHYQAVEKFRKEYFKNLITEEHLIDSEKFFKKYLDIQGDEYELNEFAYVFQKEGKKYILPSKFKKELPIGFNTTEKVSIKDQAYYRILDPFPAKFIPEKSLTMRQLVDTIAGFSHSEPMQYRLDVMSALTQVISKAFFRKSSVPSFGKDSTIAILGSLSYKALTVENPTIAKLELLSSTKLLAVNELNDISTADWKMIEQFLLAVGAFKETYTKRSRATSGVGETIDISDLSVAIMYNDIDCYDSNDKYFDTRATKQCKDRFPALRFYGGFTEDFNQIDSLDIDVFVKEHWDTYKDIIRTLYYFSNPSNVLRGLKRFKVNEHLSSSSRWSNSLNKLLRIVDLYCETQEEFDEYVFLLKRCMNEYESMVRYPSLVQRLALHLKLKKDERKDIYRLQDLLLWFDENTSEEKKQMDSHKDIVSRIHNYIKEESFIKVEGLIKSWISEFESTKKQAKKSVASLNSKHW